MEQMRRLGWSWGVPLLCLLVLIVLAVNILRNSQRAGATAEPPALILLCGAGLRPPVEEIVDAFQRRHGGRVEIQYGASNLLLGQLELAERGDVFLPGDAYYIEEAASRGLVADSTVIAWFVPVILVAADNPRGIATVADLGRAGIRLAVADQRAAAIGRITPEIFRRNGVAAADVARNTVFTAVTAPEIGQAVALGHVDATIVWRPVAWQYSSNTAMIAIPAEQNILSPVAAAVLQQSAHRDHAQDLVAFMSGEFARETFRRHRYDLPE